MFRPLLWSYDFDRVDPEKMKKTVVFQVLKYGSMAQWNWVRNKFGELAIRKILKDAPQGQFDEKNKNLISLYFNFNDWKTTQRSVKR